MCAHPNLSAENRTALLSPSLCDTVCLVTERCVSGACLQDDIQRATDLARRSVAEFGLNARIGPLSVTTLANGGGDDSLFGREGGGATQSVVEQEVKTMLDDALRVAKQVLRFNAGLLEALGAELEKDERVSGAKLQEWLDKVRALRLLRCRDPCATAQLALSVLGKKGGAR